MIDGSFLVYILVGVFSAIKIPLILNTFSVTTTSTPIYSLNRGFPGLDCNLPPKHLTMKKY